MTCIIKRYQKLWNDEFSSKKKIQYPVNIHLRICLFVNIFGCNSTPSSADFNKSWISVTDADFDFSRFTLVKSMPRCMSFFNIHIFTDTLLSIKSTTYAKDIHDTRCSVEGTERIYFANGEWVLWMIYSALIFHSFDWYNVGSSAVKNAWKVVLNQS